MNFDEFVKFEFARLSHALYRIKLSLFHIQAEAKVARVHIKRFSLVSGGILKKNISMLAGDNMQVLHFAAE